jgi:membrane protein implicated in regulation of membrane protease activity
MLDFINSAFKGIFTVLIWIALIAVVIGGFVFLLNSSPIHAILVWIGGLLVIILSAGLVTMQIKMNENIQYLKENNDCIKILIKDLVNQYFDYIVKESSIKLRAEPDPKSNVVLSVKEGTGLILLEIGEEVTLENITAPLYKVETENGEKGWCFSGYLKKVKSKNYDT